MKPSQEVTPSLTLDLEVLAQVSPSLSDPASLEVVAEQLRTRMLSLCQQQLHASSTQEDTGRTLWRRNLCRTGSDGATRSSGFQQTDIFP